MLIDTNGTQLEVYEDSSAGAAVLFLDGALWEPVAPFFMDSYRVIRVELRSDQSTETQVLDLLGLLDGLGIEAAHLVGTGDGAEVASLLAAQAPRRVHSLVLEGLIRKNGLEQRFEAITAPVLFLTDPESALQAPIAKLRSLLRHSAEVELPEPEAERFARAVLQFYRHVTLLT